LHFPPFLAVHFCLYSPLVISPPTTTIAAGLEPYLSPAPGPKWSRPTCGAPRGATAPATPPSPTTSSPPDVPGPPTCQRSAFCPFFCPRSNFQSWSSRLRFIIIPHFLLRVSILFAAWYQCLKTALTPFPPLIYGNKHKSEAVHTKMTPPFWLAFGFPRNRKNKTLSD